MLSLISQGLRRICQVNKASDLHTHFISYLMYLWTGTQTSYSESNRVGDYKLRQNYTVKEMSSGRTFKKELEQHRREVPKC